MKPQALLSAGLNLLRLRPAARRRAFLLGLLLALAGGTRAQSVGIGTPVPNSHAALDMSGATGKGLLIPRMDSATRAQMAAPPDGLLVFQTDFRRGFWYAFGGSWLFIPDKARSGDHLGSHTATQNLDLADKQLVGNGGSSGLAISSTGQLKAAGLAGSGTQRSPARPSP